MTGIQPADYDVLAELARRVAEMRGPQAPIRGRGLVGWKAPTLKVWRQRRATSLDEVRRTIATLFETASRGMGVYPLKAPPGSGKTYACIRYVTHNPDRSVIIAAPTTEQRDEILRQSNGALHCIQSLDESTCRRLAEGDPAPIAHQKRGHNVRDHICPSCPYRGQCQETGWFGDKKRLLARLGTPEPVRLVGTQQAIANWSHWFLPSFIASCWNARAKKGEVSERAVQVALDRGLHRPLLFLDEEFLGCLIKEAEVTAAELRQYTAVMKALIHQGKQITAELDAQHARRKTEGDGEHQRGANPSGDVKRAVDPREREAAQAAGFLPLIELLLRHIEDAALATAPPPNSISIANGWLAQVPVTPELVRLAKVAINSDGQGKPFEALMDRSHAAEMHGLDNGVLVRLPPDEWRKKVLAPLAVALIQSFEGHNAMPIRRDEDGRYFAEGVGRRRGCSLWIRMSADGPSAFECRFCTTSLLDFAQQAPVIQSDGTMDVRFWREVWSCLPSGLTWRGRRHVTVHPALAPTVDHVAHVTVCPDRTWAFEADAPGEGEPDARLRVRIDLCKGILARHGSRIGVLVRKELAPKVAKHLDAAGMRVHVLGSRGAAPPANASVILGHYGAHHRATNAFEQVTALILLGTFRHPTSEAEQLTAYLRLYGADLPATFPTDGYAYGGVDAEGFRYRRDNRAIRIPSDPTANYVHQLLRSAHLVQSIERVRGVGRAADGRPAPHVYLLGYEPIAWWPYPDGVVVSSADLLKTLTNVKLTEEEEAARVVRDPSVKKTQRGVVEALRERGMHRRRQHLQALAAAALTRWRQEQGDRTPASNLESTPSQPGYTTSILSGHTTT